MADKVYLEWVAEINGMKIRASYASLEDASDQARHDLKLGKEVHRIVVFDEQYEAAYLSADDNYWAENEKAFTPDEILEGEL